MRRKHTMPFGAEVSDDDGVRFRLWAPKARAINIVLEDSKTMLPMAQLSEGWFELHTDRASVGSLYRFQIDGEINVPDPASRFQPRDVHGPSEVVDPRRFNWEDATWRGRPWREAIIYELHVGAFSTEGMFANVEEKLDYLVDLGVTAIELMPLSDFYGGRNWGYDGVLPYAPDASYGRPDDLKYLIQAAHSRRLMVFLDVVYNHFGPEGNYLRTYAPDFFTDRHRTPWGDGINFDGPGSRTVRDYFIHNALYWLEEYHFDGLRFDAVQTIADDSHLDILTELAQRVRNELPKDRHIHLVLENDDNEAHYLDSGGRRLHDAQWNDDVHHALHVLVTNETAGYYVDYADRPMRYLSRCLSEGFAYQGEHSQHRGGRLRGEQSRNLTPLSFVSFLQNHDQVGNRAFGERIHQLANCSAVRAAVAILLLAPSPPLLFMGEEFAAGSQFLYFCDFHADLADAVRDGRRKEFVRFPEFSSSQSRASIPDPNNAETFERSKLNWTETQQPDHSAQLALYRKLLAIRHSAIIPRLATLEGNHAIAVWNDRSLHVDWELADKTTLRLLANLSDCAAAPLAKPIGQLIYTTHDDKALDFERELPAWSVAWFLHP
ncbi:MAG TPA: malto-oligosyltrehalose trehalohydrolase [Terriglobales bacterium]